MAKLPHDLCAKINKLQQSGRQSDHSKGFGHGDKRCCPPGKSLVTEELFVIEEEKWIIQVMDNTSTDEKAEDSCLGVTARLLLVGRHPCYHARWWRRSHMRICGSREHWLRPNEIAISFSRCMDGVASDEAVIHTRFICEFVLELCQAAFSSNTVAASMSLGMSL
jgi:hypothetical protein